MRRNAAEQGWVGELSQPFRPALWAALHLFACRERVPFLDDFTHPMVPPAPSPILAPSWSAVAALRRPAE
jgi:hypothetical protein